MTMKRDRCIAKSKLLIGGLIFGLWNNVGTVYNAFTLSEKGHHALASLTIFLLFFPGIITSVAFLIIRTYEFKSEGKDISIPELIVGACVLLFLYPILPFVFCILTLYDDNFKRNYEVLKLLEGFLDDGPQFVLKLTIVVVIGLQREKGDAIFILSMITSFASMTYHGIKFNEPHAKWFMKLFLIFPMYSMILLSRSFTLSVFLKETILESGTRDLLIGILIFIIYICINILAFKFAGQDHIRCVIFGCSSLIIPAGYNNIKNYYQRPHQLLGKIMATSRGEPSSNESRMTFLPLRFTSNDPPMNGGEEDFHPDDHSAEPVDSGPKMRSGLFLLIYNLADAALLLCVTFYLYFFRNLSITSKDALTLPQLLCIIPGFFLILARAVLYEDLRSNCCSEDSGFCRVLVIILSVLLALVGYGSLIPASLWTFFWKFLSDPSSDVDT